MQGYLSSFFRGMRWAGRYAKGYFEPGRFEPSRDPSLTVEATNTCGSKCIYCPNSIMTREKESMDMKIFKKTIDEYAAMGGHFISFTPTIGDPLLDKNLIERGRYVKQYAQFASLGFFTPLQWLHRHDINDFFSAGFTWLGISISLSGKESYKSFFGVDRYEQTVKNLETLIHENNRRGNSLKLTIFLVPTDEPIEKVAKHPDLIRIKSLLGQDSKDCIEEQRGAYVDDWHGNVKLPEYLRRTPLYPRYFRPCRMLFSGLTVHSNGLVDACRCHNFDATGDLILGDIKDTELNEMWNGVRLKFLRDNWKSKSKVPDICQKCRSYLY